MRFMKKAGHSQILDLPKYATLKTAIAAIELGSMVILVDSEDRENEGDLILAAQHVTPEKINFMSRQACGLICLSMPPEQVERLGLYPMARENQGSRKTAFMVSIEATEGVSTGISAADRAHTIRVASLPTAERTHVQTPGHVFPLRAVPGGVLERPGHTEGSLELCKLAGLNEAAVICEIMNPDGSMARRDDLNLFSLEHDIPVVTIELLIEYLKECKASGAEIMPPNALLQNRLEKGPTAKLPTPWGEFKIQSFKNVFTGQEHLAVIRATDISGIRSPELLPLVRVHSECLTGDALGSLRCDCGAQLELALESIFHSGYGALIYLNGHEGRGIGLFNKIQAYALQDRGANTAQANEQLGFEIDQRSYEDAAFILKELGMSQIKLLTNNPQKKMALDSMGIKVVEQVKLQVALTSENEKYLKAKKEILKHTLQL